MTTATDNLIAHLAGHRLSVDEQSWARASYSWALAADGSSMKRCLSQLSDEALGELIFAAELLAGMAVGTLKQRGAVAAAVLTPDAPALPDGVDGFPFSGRLPTRIPGAALLTEPAP